MIITREFLDRAVGNGLVPCYEQCREFGMLFPAPKKWKSAFEGKEIKDERAERFLALKDKAILNPKLLKRKPCGLVHSTNEDKIIVTEEWLRSGMKSGVGIKKMQAKVLGVNIKRKGWLRGLVGSEIPKSVAEEYMKLA